MPNTVGINRMLLIAVVVLAAALVAVVTYFLVIKPSPPKTTQHATQVSSALSQEELTTEAFERGVDNWLNLVCIYNKYGGNATLAAIDNIYDIAYDYLMAYEGTNNITYVLLYPIAQYQYLVSNYPECAINENAQDLVNTVESALGSINTIAYTLNIPQDLLGTPMFVVFNRANNVTYILAGASPLVYNAINYSLRGYVTPTINYQGQTLGIGYRANSTQVMLIQGLISSGLGVGNPNASLVVIEFLDPTCPYCAVFQVMYGGQLQEMISNGTVYYVVHYFPTHVLGYGCSSPTIAPMLGTLCQ